jgi:hypothetical protein
MRSSAWAAVLLVTGCYNYYPLENPAPASGTRVAAELTDAGSIEMSSQIGPGVTSVHGEVVESSSDALTLALTSVMNRNEQEMPWNGEQVRIPLTTVARVEQRRFAVVKSILFAGAIVGGLFAATQAFETADRGGGGGGGGGGPGTQ